MFCVLGSKFALFFFQEEEKDSLWILRKDKNMKASTGFSVILFFSLPSFFGCYSDVGLKKKFDTVIGTDISVACEWLKKGLDA